MTRKQFAGGAVATTITPSINSVTTTIVVTDASSYPSGATPFVIAIDRNTASEEKILVTRAAASNTLTAVTRGFDGTTAVAHADGAIVEHVLDALTVDQANLLANTLTTAGDLLVGGVAGAPTRLGVGSTNQVLSVSSGTPAWQTVVPGMRNLLINGAFDVNQRGFSSSTGTNLAGFDRWVMNNNGGTVTQSAQSALPGAISEDQGVNYLRVVTAGQAAAGDFAILSQWIEDVRTVANRRITLSFWARATSGTPRVALELEQNFGSGGSPSASVPTYAGQVTLSTTWTRYSVSVDVPSISGKTLGTDRNTSALGVRLWFSAGSTYNARTNSLGVQNNTFEVWGVQAEVGAAATSFEYRPLAMELVACERYFQRYGGGALYELLAQGFAYSATDGLVILPLRTAMRVAPQLAIGTGLGQVLWIAAPNLSGNSIFTTTLVTNGTSRTVAHLSFTSAGMVAGPVMLRANNNLNATWDFSAEYASN